EPQVRSGVHSTTQQEQTGSSANLQDNKTTMGEVIAAAVVSGLVMASVGVAVFVVYKLIKRKHESPPFPHVAVEAAAVDDDGYLVPVAEHRTREDAPVLFPHAPEAVDDDAYMTPIPSREGSTGSDIGESHSLAIPSLGDRANLYERPVHPDYTVPNPVYEPLRHLYETTMTINLKFPTLNGTLFKAKENTRFTLPFHIKSDCDIPDNFIINIAKIDRETQLRGIFCQITHVNGTCRNSSETCKCLEENGKYELSKIAAHADFTTWIWWMDEDHERTVVVSAETGAEPQVRSGVHSTTQQEQTGSSANLQDNKTTMGEVIAAAVVAGLVMASVGVAVFVVYKLIKRKHAMVAHEPLHEDYVMIENTAVNNATAEPEGAQGVLSANHDYEDIATRLSLVNPSNQPYDRLRLHATPTRALLASPEPVPSGSNNCVPVTKTHDVAKKRVKRETQICSYTTCEAPSVSEGQPASITCHFDHNVSEKKTAFAVHRYDDEGLAKDILSCQWIKDKHNCDTAEGYDYAVEASGTVTLKIPMRHRLKKKFWNQGSKERDDDEPSTGVALLERGEAKQEETARIARYDHQAYGNSSFCVSPELRGTHPQPTSPPAVSQSEGKRDQRNQKPYKEGAGPTDSNDGVYEIGDNGETELHTASRNGDKNRVKHLLSKGADIRSRDSRGWTPLHAASFSGATEVVKLLHQKGLDLNVKAGDGSTPLHLACGQHKDVLKFLLKNKANVEARDNDGRTPLHLASQTDQASLVKHLLDAGANSGAKDKRFRTPLHVACEASQESVVKVLLGGKASVKEKDEKDQTPLHLACAAGSMPVAKLLIESGANIEAKDKTGCTPLHMACEIDSRRLVDILLRSNARTDTKDNNGCTPLHVACQTSSTSVVKLLLNAGASTAAADSNGCTSLHLACQNDAAFIVNELLRCNADMAATNNSGCTPLHLACRKDNKTVFSILLSRGASHESKAKDGSTPLHTACREGNELAVTALLKSGAFVDVKDDIDWTPLFCACHVGADKIVEMLLAYGADLKARDNTGMTALHVACRAGKKNVAGALLNAGAEIEAKDKEGRTPLHLACQAGRKEVVKVLVKEGANKKAKTKSGVKPLQLVPKSLRQDFEQEFR
ncbi:hypothetical protein BaRGS_00013347, partial [Batillaria attramentaria]